VHPSDEVPPTARDDGRRGEMEPKAEGLERQNRAEMPEQGPVPEVKSGKGLRSLALSLSWNCETNFKIIWADMEFPHILGGIHTIHS